MARRLVIIKGITLLTQKITQSANMANAFFPSSVSPCGVDEKVIKQNINAAKKIII